MSATRRRRIRAFWVYGGLIGILGATLLGRDIDRPYYGLHGLDQAHQAWLARSHVEYGLRYTHGYPTFAVGRPPAAEPIRYLDHPVLHFLINAGTMTVLGVNTWALRVSNIVATVLTLLILLRLLRALADDLTALLAGFVFVQLPLIAYFGVNQWLYPLGLLAFWNYLVIIQEVDGVFPTASQIHRIGLPLAIFLAIQISWNGTFFAVAIGLHYVGRSFFRKSSPNWILLSTIAFAALGGLALDFVMLLAGDDWNLERLIQLAKWRAGSAEREVHEWGAWFARLWEFALSNFTWVPLVLAMTYLTLGQVIVHSLKSSGNFERLEARQFPQFWLFLLPAVLQLLLLKGVLWEHQWWERPLAPFVAIATALGTLMIVDYLARVYPPSRIPALVLLMGAISLSTFIGTNRYFATLNYYPERLVMFEALQKQIPEEEALLSFESYLFDQRPGVKQGSLRPEVGWHLDRDIVVARRLEEILARERTGRFPFYLMPSEHRKEEVNQYLGWLRRELQTRYAYRQVQGQPDQWIFDLRKPVGTSLKMQTPTPRKTHG